MKKPAAVILDGGHSADHDAFRVNPPEPRRDDDVAFRHILTARNIDQTRMHRVVRRPLDNSRHTGTLHQRARRRARIEDKLYLRGNRAGIRHSAHKTASRDHGHIFLYAVLGSPINDDHARPSRRFPPDNVRHHKIELRRGLLIAQKLPQTNIFSRVLIRLHVLHPQLLHFTAEHLILLMHR